MPVQNRPQTDFLMELVSWVKFFGVPTNVRLKIRKIDRSKAADVRSISVCVYCTDFEGFDLLEFERSLKYRQTWSLGSCWEWTQSVLVWWIRKKKCCGYGRVIVIYYLVISKQKNRMKWVKNWIARRKCFVHMPLPQNIRDSESNDLK